MQHVSKQNLIYSCTLHLLLRSHFRYQPVHRAVNTLSFLLWLLTCLTHLVFCGATNSSSSGAIQTKRKTFSCSNTKASKPYLKVWKTTEMGGIWLSLWMRALAYVFGKSFVTGHTWETPQGLFSQCPSVQTASAWSGAVNSACAAAAEWKAPGVYPKIQH